MNQSFAQDDFPDRHDYKDLKRLDDVSLTQILNLKLEIFNDQAAATRPGVAGSNAMSALHTASEFVQTAFLSRRNRNLDQARINGAAALTLFQQAEKLGLEALKGPTDVNGAGWISQIELMIIGICRGDFGSAREWMVRSLELIQNVNDVEEILPPLNKFPD